MKCFLIIFLFFNILLCNIKLNAQNLRDDFSVKDYLEGFTNPMALNFAENGDLFVCEKDGKLYYYHQHDGHKHQVIDISEEVADFGDHGLMSFELDNNFLDNGKIYLLYAADRHYIENYGTPEYSEDSTAENSATIARITSYELDINNDYNLIENSGKILIGDTLTNGMPITFPAHGAGDIEMGTDGSLLASMGDGANFETVDTGGFVGDSYTPKAVQDGWLPEKYDIGSLRAQLIDCMNGKVIRIDPETGQGLPSNPFYDEEAPDAPKSKVWTLGLRMPFRFNVVPGSGSHNINDGSPGKILIGDVGRFRWEEITMVTEGGENLGWPFFEGYHRLNEYYYSNRYNKDAPNQLSQRQSCDREYFYFRDLFGVDKEYRTNKNIELKNPCDPDDIIENVPVFEHKRPVFDYFHHSTGESRKKTYDENGDPSVEFLYSSDFNDEEHKFGGLCIIGGTWYDGDNFPEKFQNSYFFADFDMDWIKSLKLDSSNGIQKINDFSISPATNDMLDMNVNPENGKLYYIDYHGGKIVEISYKDSQPEAIITSDKKYGYTPFTVNFSAEKTKNPVDSLDLLYEWEFDDGTVDTGMNISYNFTSNEIKKLRVRLIVTNAIGDTSIAEEYISINNTPPQTEIVTPADSTLYPLTHETEYQLKANVYDEEQDTHNLNYKWIVNFHHNTHYHPDAPITEQEADFTLNPAGCGEDSYYYRVKLTVSDGYALSDTDEVYLYPDCENAIPYIYIEDTIKNVYTFNDNFEIGIPDSLFFDDEDSIDLEWGLKSMELSQLPEWLTFNKKDKVISGSDIEDISGSYNFKLYVEDSEGARAYKNFQININPNSVPHNMHDVSDHIGLYPNPNDAKNLVIDMHKQDNNKYKLVFFNDLGKRIREYNSITYNKNVINVKGLADGIYFVKVINENKNKYITIKKIIIR